MPLPVYLANLFSCFFNLLRFTSRTGRAITMPAGSSKSVPFSCPQFSCGASHRREPTILCQPSPGNCRLRNPFTLLRIGRLAEEVSAARDAGGPIEGLFPGRHQKLRASAGFPGAAGRNRGTRRFHRGSSCVRTATRSTGWMVVGPCRSSWLAGCPRAGRGCDARKFRRASGQGRARGPRWFLRGWRVNMRGIDSPRFPYAQFCQTE